MGAPGELMCAMVRRGTSVFGYEDALVPVGGVDDGRVEGEIFVSERVSWKKDWNGQGENVKATCCRRATCWCSASVWMVIWERPGALGPGGGRALNAGHGNRCRALWHDG